MDKLTPTAEETRLLGLLRDEWWQKHAPSRGVKNTTIGEARLTKSGVVVKLLLDLEMTMEKLERMLPQIRTLLDIQDDHQTDLLPGGRASKAALAVRTRRVTDLMDMTWSPGTASIGVDTITGSEVFIPLASQIQVAGAKGSGKSWALRPLIMAALGHSDFEPVYLDPKMVEGALMRNVIRTAMGGDQILKVIDQEYAEMWQRGEAMAQSGETVWDPKNGPYKLLIVDEGRDLLATLRMEDARQAKEARRNKGEDGLLEDYIPYLLKMIRISSMGRAWGYFIWWVTQYPIVSGPNPGIDTNIDANADYRFSLRVGKQQHATVALADDADYGPHLIPAGDHMRGHGYLGEHGPTLIRTWTVTDEMVRHFKGNGGAPAVLPPDPPASQSASPVMNEDLVRQMMDTSEMLTAAQIAIQHGGDAKSVAKILTDLMVLGEIGSRFDGQTHLYGKSLR